ncbi:MAG TPA: AIR synthase-related protein, partial [Chloroflexia bacterium]|nr:AIR synthase-related protein [Chloroflexia bacterium]
RNLSCVGAEPLAVTDCLNFGNPERPHVYYQMESAVEGIADACKALGVPVVSGNVSLYNETNGVAVLPTPVIGMLGLQEDVERRAGLAFRDGMAIGLLWAKHAGDEPYAGGGHLLGASQYAETCLGLKAGMPPPVDLEAERKVQQVCREAIRLGIVDIAHDCSDGGLAVALAEGCIAGGVGASIRLDELEKSHPGLRSDVLLFAEEPSRLIVSLPLSTWDTLVNLASSMEVSLCRLGDTGGNMLNVERGNHQLVSLPMLHVAAAWQGQG